MLLVRFLKEVNYYFGTVNCFSDNGQLYYYFRASVDITAAQGTPSLGFLSCLCEVAFIYSWSPTFKLLDWEELEAGNSPQTVAAMGLKNESTNCQPSILTPTEPSCSLWATMNSR